MQRILHHVDFQAMESAWQGLYFLVSRLETDSLLTLSLVDISKNELASDLFATDDLRRTALYKLWHDPAGGIPGGRPWSVVAGNFFFEKQDKDLELLGRTAKIAAAAGICFVAGAGDRFVCENSLADTPDPDDWNPSPDKGTHDKWLELRHLSEASYIGLALPRMLLRLPYGEETDPIDAFHFEEMPIPGAHKDYLWGNPCFALILLMGQAFSLQGRQMQPGAVLEINSLPLHVLKKDGQSHLTPCAETLLSMRAAEQILENGLMPLVSFLNQDKIRIGRFQSIAEPLARLSGPWD
jgi:type VI secretion system protein ImpC